MKFNIYPINQFTNFDRPYQPYWVFKDALEDYWSKDIDYFESGTQNSFNGSEDIFYQIEAGEKLVGEWIFKIGRACIGTRNGRYCLYFSDGRHRTRWLIDSHTDIELVPLALDANSISRAIDIGLLSKPILEFDKIDLQVSKEMILSERESFALLT